MCGVAAANVLIDNENDEASMLRLRRDDSAALSLLAAIRAGDLPSLQGILAEQPALAFAIIGEGAKSRTPLHAAMDWPGHFPNGAAIVTALIDAGADPNVRREGVEYPETPLHWVACNDDVEIFEVLMKAGADIEATGGSIGGGTPLDNAVGYGQWRIARRLVECGARTRLWHVAALGLMSEVEAYFAADPPPTSHEVTEAFYQACEGDQQRTAEYLLERGADINWIPTWGKGTALDRARRRNSPDLVQWLISRGRPPAL
jgi:ankyrin repeat protein